MAQKREKEAIDQIRDIARLNHFLNTVSEN